MAPRKTKSLDELSADEVVQACEENYDDYWKCIGMSPNAEYREGRGITYCVTGLHQEIFNVVVKCDLDVETVDSRIDGAIRCFRQQRLPMIWNAGILSRPRDIGRYLEARGFPHDYDLAAMAVDVDAVDDVCSEENASVRTVLSNEDNKRWVECLASSWESPSGTVPWMLQNACFSLSAEAQVAKALPRRMYLGLLEGEAVTAAMLLWNDEIAGLQTVGTVKSAEGKGVGTSVTGTALRDARALGFKFVVVLSTVEGVRLYRKVGFRTYGKLPEHAMYFDKLRP